IWSRMQRSRRNTRPKSCARRPSIRTMSTPTTPKRTTGSSGSRRTRSPGGQRSSTPVRGTRNLDAAACVVPPSWCLCGMQVHLTESVPGLREGLVQVRLTEAAVRAALQKHGRRAEGCRRGPAFRCGLRRVLDAGTGPDLLAYLLLLQELAGAVRRCE